MVPEASNASECWHSIVVRGRNSSTYKMAMAWCLAKSVEVGRLRITRDELAEAFLDLYADRLKNGMPQLSDPNAKTVIEGIIRKYSKGELERSAAIKEARSRAFNDAISAFHKVDRADVPVRFYTIDAQDGGLVLTEELRLLMTREGTDHILAEIDQKWSELELAWKRARVMNVHR